MRRILSLPLILAAFGALAAAHKHLPLGGSDHEEAPVGTNVTLRCNFTADPGVGLGDLSAHWIKDGDTIFFVNKTYTYPKSVGAHIKEELQKGEASLPLSDVTKEDAGKYTCAIKYGTKWGSLSITLRVLGGTDGQRSEGPSMTHGAGGAMAAWCAALLLLFGYRP
ncbi:hypothetical protein XENTR_v10023000 [Xenopus tropicalis]|nr:hypothetical protein XENTR_v10023000 [Xenopus tropicalis]